MLKTLRHHQSNFLRAMLLAIVGVFIFWGIGTVGTGERVQGFATVNGELITAREYQRAYENLQRAYAQMSRGTSLPTEMLRAQAADQLISSRLLLQEARRLELEVSDEEVRQAISQMPAFQQEGKFSNELYKQVLQQNGFKPTDYQKLQREQLLARKLQTMVAGGVVVTEDQVRDRFRFEQEQVNLRYAKIRASDFVDRVTVTEEELKSHYEAHKESYREPERVRIRLARFEATHFGATFQPGEEEIKSYYDEHIDEYRQQEEVRARHILLRLEPGAGAEKKQQVRQRANELRGKAVGGADFTALARESSEDPGSRASGGDLGFFSRGKMVPQFEEAAFALQPGAISDVVETPYGFHIIKVEEKRSERQKELAEVRDDVIEALRQRHGREQALTKVEEAHKAVAGGQDFDAVVKGAGLSVEETQPFAREEMILIAKPETGDGRPAAPLPRDPALIDAAFATDPGQLGEIVTLESGYVLFQGKDRRESYVPAFEEARPRVERELRKEKAAAAAKERAQALLTKLKENADIDGLAAAEGLHVEETGPTGRLGSYVTNLGTAPQLKEAAFRLTAEQKVAPEVYDVAGDSVIAVLAARTPADESKFAEQKKNLIEQERQRAEADAVNRYLNYLKSQASIQYEDAFADRAG